MHTSLILKENAASCPFNVFEFSETFSVLTKRKIQIEVIHRLFKIFSISRYFAFSTKRAISDDFQCQFQIYIILQLLCHADSLSHISRNLKISAEKLGFLFSKIGISVLK